MKLRVAALFGLTALALAACGTTTEDRALSGGAIGAGVGAGAGALSGGNVLGGALLGGAGGAAAGGLTKPSDIDLGKPVWKR
jgi:osmotically inducible lipoprotein OsmB